MAEETLKQVFDAVAYGDLTALHAGLAAGVSVDAVDSTGQTLLGAGSVNGQHAIVQALIDAGASVNAVDRQGYTALHQASYYGMNAVVKVLLAAGADPEAKTPSGQTPFDVAKELTNAQICAVLDRHAQGVLSPVGSAAHLQTAESLDTLAPLTAKKKDAPPRRRVRRGSVSAESDRPSTLPTATVIFPKAPEVKKAILAAIGDNLLLRGLEEPQKVEIVMAMKDEDVEAGKVIIKQGDPYAEHFYVVKSGSFGVYVKDATGNEACVATLTEPACFGDLALMYNCPRSATVKAEEAGSVWVLDRSTFNQIRRKNQLATYDLYQAFLTKVPLLESLSDTERKKIADALHPKLYVPGEKVIEQGAEGDRFYIIEEGEAEAVISTTDDAGESTDKVVKQYQAGDYFGELALLNKTARAASVVAKSQLRCVVLESDAFTRLLGPCQDILKRNQEMYAKYASLVEPTGLAADVA